VAYPSGSGSEILRRGSMHNHVTAETTFKFDGTHPTVGTATDTVPANHIITIVSIFITDMSNAPMHFTMRHIISAVEYVILKEASIPAKGTYVWNDPIVVHGGDTLKINADSQSGANFDVYYSYIDQDWT